MALIAKRQHLALRVPVEDERHGGPREQRCLEFHILDTVKTVVWCQYPGGVVHHPVELGDAGQQGLYGKMALEPEQRRIEVQDNLKLLRLCLMAPDFMDFHEITPVTAHRHACSYCSPAFHQ